MRDETFNTQDIQTALKEKQHELDEVRARLKEALETIEEMRMQRYKPMQKIGLGSGGMMPFRNTELPDTIWKEEFEGGIK